MSSERLSVKGIGRWSIGPRPGTAGLLQSNSLDIIHMAECSAIKRLLMKLTTKKSGVKIANIFARRFIRRVAVRDKHSIRISNFKGRLSVNAPSKFQQTKVKPIRVHEGVSQTKRKTIGLNYRSELCSVPMRRSSYFKPFRRHPHERD